MSGLSHRIHAELGQRIRSGAWPAGHRVPTEQALAESYGCARMTVSQALAALAREGLVERRRRAGTFVSRPPAQTALLEIPDIAAVICAQGDAYAFAELSRDIRPSLEDADEGPLGGGEVLAISGTHGASGHPFALEWRIIRLALVPEAAAADFTATGPGGWLLAHAPWSDARHRISAVAAEVADARRLRIAAGSPCLQMERWTWTPAGGVTFTRQRFPGGSLMLSEHFRPAVEGR